MAMMAPRRLFLDPMTSLTMVLAEISGNWMTFSGLEGGGSFLPTPTGGCICFLCSGRKGPGGWYNSGPRSGTKRTGE